MTTQQTTADAAALSEAMFALENALARLNDIDTTQISDSARRRIGATLKNVDAQYTKTLRFACKN
jgi:hypothetical protein